MDEATLVLGNTSGLYESDMVMFDHGTGSYWQQVNGTAIVGPLTGKQLKLVPSQTTTWQLWKQQYPQTKVLARVASGNRNYDKDPFAGMGKFLNEGGKFPLPVSEAGHDSRLPSGSVVLGVQVGALQRAYPVEQLGDAAVNDLIGATPVVIFSRTKGNSAAAYEAMVDGKRLTFRFADDRFLDNQTNSTWSLSGVAVSGPMAGTHMQALPVRSTFWFSMISSFPDVQLYEKPE